MPTHAAANPATVHCPMHMMWGMSERRDAGLHQLLQHGAGAVAATWLVKAWACRLGMRRPGCREHGRERYLTRALAAAVPTQDVMCVVECVCRCSPKVRIC